jgi:hypothetical protein
MSGPTQAQGTRWEAPTAIANCIMVEQLARIAKAKALDNISAYAARLKQAKVRQRYTLDPELINWSLSYPFA